METVNTQPSATPVIQALRSIGYNAQTAIADIVDNSIDAKAKNIYLEFKYQDGSGYIRIEDDGIGMTEEELQKAMTIGSKDPRAKRAKKELGRFGMGLKTASFSLGKRLCVVTKKSGRISERCWDLEFVSEKNEWLLYNSIPKEIRDKVGSIESENGTIVYIDQLDRFSGYRTVKPLKKESYFSKINRIHKYLETVFHEKIEEGLFISINGMILNPWNPFLIDNPRVEEGEEQYIRVNKQVVKITPYVLPHPSTFNQIDYKYAGGIKGWRDQQGFYVYRENRMVTNGDWFGMFPKDVQSELVRIKVEFKNEADDEWKIDVKKSTISVPDEIKEDLKSIAKYYRQLSQEKMLYRTKSTKNGERLKGSLNTWELETDEIESKYILNRTHPILNNVLKSLDTGIKRKLNLYLKLVELGSPNNLLKTSYMAKREEQVIDDHSKQLIIECAESFISAGIPNLTLDNIAETISMFSGFEGIEIYTIKDILEREVNFNESRM